VADEQEQKQEPPKAEVKDNLVETKHSITLNGETIAYTVTTGTIVLKQEAEKEGASEGEKPKASFFFVAYTRDDVENPATRPLTFSFNGGPGSSSVWLHLGVLGPRRVAMTDIGDLPPPPYKLVANEFSLLDVSDLVFIDPVGTGYSRVVQGEKDKEFHSLKKDIESVGDFIRLYTTRYARWLSPKFLIGESYGTTRAAGLSGYLQERHGLYLNGIMLVSSILDFSTADFQPGNDLPYILFLPTYAATAWYHQKLEPALQRDLQTTLREVEAFALNEYALALLKGDALPDIERARIVKKLARYTGLAAVYIERANLRLEIFHFTKELLRNVQRTVGRLDARFTGMDRDQTGATLENDPSYTNIIGPYTAALYDYIRRELKFESDLPYEILSLKVNQQWSFDEHENRYVSVADTLRSAMSINPHLQVFVANGYYDLATPYFATQYTFHHLALDPSLRGNVSMTYYEAGHMMYIHLPSLAKLKDDLTEFIRGAIPAN
jgi:carboxypeptidase C (cathepsin A)